MPDLDSSQNGWTQVWTMASRAGRSVILENKIFSSISSLRPQHDRVLYRNGTRSKTCSADSTGYISTVALIAEWLSDRGYSNRDRTPRDFANQSDSASRRIAAQIQSSNCTRLPASARKLSACAPPSWSPRRNRLEQPHWFGRWLSHKSTSAF